MNNNSIEEFIYSLFSEENKKNESSFQYLKSTEELISDLLLFSNESLNIKSLIKDSELELKSSGKTNSVEKLFIDGVFTPSLFFYKNRLLQESLYFF